MVEFFAKLTVVVAIFVIAYSFLSWIYDKVMK